MADSNQQVTQTTIPVSALGSLGFAPSADAAVTPKTRDIFDFSTPVDKLTGASIADALKNQKKEETEGAPERKPETGVDGQPKPIIPDAKLLNSIADGIHQDIVEAGKQDDVEGVKSGDAPVQGDKSDKAYKNALVSYIEKKIKKEEFQPYADFDEAKKDIKSYLNDFTNEELEELTETNNKTREETF